MTWSLLFLLLLVLGSVALMSWSRRHTARRRRERFGPPGDDDRRV